MKNIFLPLLLLTCFSATSLAQRSITIPSDFDDANQKVTVLEGQRRVNILCDTVYLINKSYLNRLTASFQEETGLFQTEITRLENNLAETQQKYDNLHQDFLQLYDISNSNFENINTALGETDATLSSVQSTLTQTNEDLADLQQFIKDGRKKAFWDKVWVVLGGVAVGVLLTEVIN